MNFKNLRKVTQRGFTMIELVIVIAILGILAALAVPRFASFTTQAGTNARTSVAGSLNSAISIVHAQWVANGSTDSEIFLEGQSGAGNGIPIVTAAAAGTTRGYLNMSGIAANSDCVTLVGKLMSNTNGLTIAMGTPGSSCTINGSGFATPVTLTATSAS